MLPTVLRRDLSVVLTPKECKSFSFVQSDSAVVRLIYFTINLLMVGYNFI